MKKAAGLIAVLMTAILICSLFAGCAKDNSDGSDTSKNTEDTAESTVDTKDTETETESEPESSETVAGPISGLEPVSEEIETERLLMMNTRASKFLKSKLYIDGDTSLTWYKFFNACVRGEVDVASEKSAEFINECLSFFEENGLDDEVEQANALLSAAKART